MKLIITSLVILLGLTSQSFSEEVKDVGLICKEGNDEISGYRMFWFKGNGRLEKYIRDLEDLDKDGNKVEYNLDDVVSNNLRYVTNDRRIEITFLNDDGSPNYNIGFRINRFDLTMVSGLYGYQTHYQCGSFSNKQTFFSKIKEIEKTIEKFLNKRKI